MPEDPPIPGLIPITRDAIQQSQAPFKDKEDSAFLPQEDVLPSSPIYGLKQVSPKEIIFQKYKMDIAEDIQKEKEKIRENYEELSGDKYITDDEKQDRMDEIDATIEKLKIEQTNIAERGPSDNQYRQFDLATLAVKAVEDKLRKKRGIDYLSEEIKKLYNERSRLDEELTPVTDSEINDVLNNYGLANTFKDLSIIDKYGQDRTQKIYNKALNKQLDVIGKAAAKIPTPENILSYNSLAFGEELKQKYADSTQLNTIWKTVTENPEYGRAMFDKKRKMLYDGVKEFVSTKEDVEDKDKAAQHILNRMLTRFAQSEDGNLSIEGLKLFAEYQLDRINTTLEWNRDALGPILGKDAKLAQQHMDRLIKQYGEENVKQWYQTIQNDALSLGQTKEQLRKILEIPEAKHGLRDVGKAFKSVSATDFMYGVPDMLEAMNITRITKKAEAGKTLNFGEETAMTVYATSTYVDKYDTKGRWFQAIYGATTMIPYVAQFLLTGGFYDITKTGAVKLVAPITRKYIGKQMPRVADLTAESIGRVSGVLAQSLAMPQMYVKYTAENIRPDVIFAEDMDGISYTLLENTGDTFLKGAVKGYLSTFAEMAFERSGKYLMRAPAGAGKLVNLAKKKLTGKEFMERKILDNFMKLKGIKSAESLSKYVTRHNLGWDGIMGEYLEELGTYFVEQKIQGQSLFGDDFFNDQLVTAMTVALFGMPMKMVTATRSYLVGNEMMFDTIDQRNGEKKRIGIPMTVWNDFTAFFREGEGLFDDVKFTELIEKHKSKLNQEQFELIFSITKAEGQNRMVNLIRGRGKKGKPEPVPGYDPTIFGKKKPTEELTDKEKKEIKKVNRKIVKNHPDLARLDLLIQDPSTGQYIEPSKIVIKELYDQVRAEWSEKAELDKLGNVINLTPELEKIQKQKDVLEEYTERMHDKEVEYTDLAIAEKHERLSLELKEGKKLVGTSSIVTDRKIQVKLEDGRAVDIFLNVNLDKNEREKVNKAILNNEEVELKLQSWEEWNPDLEIKDRSGKPYWDRIQAFLGDLPIGNVQIFDFAEESRRTRELKEEETEIAANLKESAADFFEAVVTKTGGLTPAVPILSEDERNELGEKFVAMIRDAGDWTGIKIEQVMQKIIDWIKGMDNLSIEQKGFMLAMAKENEKEILRAVAEKQFVAKGFKREAKELTLDDIVFPGIEGVAPSGAYKLDMLMQGYAPVWRAIAEKLETTKELVEKRMYKIAKQEGVLGNLQNEATFSHFLGTLTGLDRVTDAIIDVLKRGSLSSAVSLFNFYSNIYLAKQYGVLIQKGNVITTRLLNPSQRYDEFIDSFWDRIKRYRITGGYTGYDAVMRRINMHNEERDKRFNSRNQNWVWYDSQTSEKREELRREQHESDVLLLAEISGISSDVWNQYFTKQTKETLAKPARDVKTQTEYGTYDNLLKHDTWRKDHRRIQSNIAFNMSLLPTVVFEGRRVTRKPEEFEFALNAFIMQGNEDTGTLSNLYKLSTAITAVDDIGQSGIDIKSDRFNSFIQSSDVSETAHNILSSSVDNHIVDYYQGLQEPMELVFINGLHHLGLNPDEKGTHNVNMSNEDIWMTQIHSFLEEGNSYLHWTGQFGDKPSLMFVRAPKIAAPTKIQYRELIKGFPDYTKAVNWFYSEYLEQKQELFSFLFKSLSFQERKEKRKDLAKTFVYNFARNIRATNELFFGKEEQYTSLVDIVKRGGSSNSPGYRLNPFVEGGVGKTFQFAMVDDLIGGAELFDGCEFMSGEYAERSQVSMGSGLSRINEPGYEILSSMKALTSFIDEETGLRGLTKGNRTNIELHANDLPDSKYKHIRDFMEEYKIDVLSFASTTKKHEKTTDKKEAAIVLWNKDGSLKKKPVIPEHGIVTRQTKDVYIQQDLRHSSEAKSTKMPSQLLGSMLILNNGPAISEMINQLQTKTIIDMMKEFDGKPSDEVKLKWLKENVNENTQPELFKLLKAGITVYEPAMANYMRTMLAGALTRKALQVPINRLTTQEIADPGEVLEGRKPYKDKNGVDHILLPDAGANVSGARYENAEYSGKPEQAKAFVLANKELHRDLFDVAGNYMEWVVEGRNGIIPGEYTILNRVPVSGLHSHTVARLKYKMSTGNFTMLDMESRLDGGSDLDGDQRFNQVFFRGETGKIILDDSKKGIANKMMMAIAEDYTDPFFNERITDAINVNKYDTPIVDKYRDDKKYSSVDPRGYDKARNENMVGVKLKGALTDATTVYSIIASRNLDFRYPVQLPVKKGIVALEGFVRDPVGLVKTHFANFLNMAFDNAADPKLEIIGINEFTVNMFVITLLGNKKLDTETDDAIMKHIEQVVEYFTSPILRRFTNMMRRDSGGLRRVNLKKLEERLSREFTEAEARRVVDFYKVSREMSELRRFYSLTQKASNSAVELEIDKALYDAVAENDRPKFKLINVKNLFNDQGSPVTEFATAGQALSISERYIYVDTFNYSETGQQIMSAVMNLFPKKTFFTLGELKSLDYGLNNIAAIKALNIKQGAASVEKELLENLKSYREKYPGNKFLETVHKVIRRGKYYIEIAPDYRQGRIDETKLEKIRDDFDSLWGLNKEIAEKFVANALYKWGATTSTFGGSYYSLFGYKFRVYYSKLMQNELRSWLLDEISSVEKLQIMEWILRRSKVQDFNKKAFNPSQANYYDYGSLAVLSTPVSYEALDALTGVTNANEFAEFNRDHEFDKHTMAAEMADIYRKEMLSVAKDVIPAVGRFIEEFRERALKIFPPASGNNISVKDMLPNDSIGEALISEDVELQKFVYERLRKMYPDVVFFTGRDAFFTFVKKWGGKGFNVSPHAIGHAFKNAVFIDPGQAVQSTLFHELSHVYWDALPKDHAIKKKLLDLYSGEFPDVFEENLEERIILDIGQASVDLANIKLRGSVLEKFKLYLKEFWRAVKAFFGVYSKIDLIDRLTLDIWENSDRIIPDTNMGNAIVRSMITYNFEDDEIPGFHGEKHTYTLGGVPIPSVTTAIQVQMSEAFNPEIKAHAKVLKDERLYRGLTKEVWSEEEKREATSALLKFWDEGASEKGTSIHSVAQTVFDDKSLPEDFIKDNFMNRNVYIKLRKIFQEIKTSILNQYPDAIFYTEPMLISKKYKIGGHSDLVVDTGNKDLDGKREIVVYEVKTTEDDYADADMNPLPEYKRAFNMFKAPFHNLTHSRYTKHTIQLNMYANMLEEQTNPKNPGEKNKVVRLRVIPIKREIDGDTKKITDVHSSHWVKIARNKKSTDIAERMMQQSYLQKQNIGDIYPEFKKNLEKLETPAVLVRDMLKAMHFLNLYTGNIKKISKTHIDDIQNEGINTQFAKLIGSTTAGGLGYAFGDIHGKDALTSEELFFISMQNITKEKYFEEKAKGEKNRFYNKQKVGAHYVAKQNPNKSDRKWHRYGNQLLQDVGIRNVEEKDRLMMIYEIPRPDGTIPTDIYYYEVLSVDRRRKKVKVRNSETGLESYLRVPGKYDGLTKIHTELPKGVKDPGPESYKAAYIYEEEIIEEVHWEVGFNIGEIESTQEGELRRNMRVKQMRKIWRLFNENKSWAELQEFYRDEEKVVQLYEELKLFDNDISEALALLTRAEARNHWMADIIRKENNQYDKVPNEMLPMTLNAYYILTNHKDMVWKDFDRAEWARPNMTPRMMEHKYVPLNMFTSQTQTENRKYLQKSFELNKVFKEFSGKIDYKVVMIEFDGRLYWRKPGEVLLEPEKGFLEALYYYYDNYDPAYREMREQGRASRIEVSKIYASRGEFKERFGSRFGSQMYTKLRPAEYDGVKLKVVIDFDKDGKEIYERDKNGKIVIRTLGEIKEQFALKNFSPEELLKYFGAKWRHIFLRIPGVPTVLGKSSAGIMNHQIKKAIDTYDKGGDGINLSDTIRKGKRRIPILGRGDIKYTTELFVEAEEKAIDSMIYAHYMKRLMAPLDWMLHKYTGIDSGEGKDAGKAITKWLRTWGEYQLYGIKPGNQSFLGGRMASDIIDFANRMNSLNKIMLSLITQVNNFAIGQTLDIVREPAAYWRGVRRIGENGNIPANLWKARNILKRYALANIVSDFTFDQIDKEMKILGVDIKKVENFGYWPMEIAEKLNQFPIFIGLMTDTEWNAYDMNGGIINEKANNHMSDFKAQIVATRTQDIHGDYSEINASPWMIYNVGKAAWQFRKWLPAMIWSHFAPYHIDRNLAIRSGLFPTFDLLTRTVKYNLSSVEERQAKRERIIRKANEDQNYESDAFFGTTQEYFHDLIKESNNGRITWKELSPSDKRNTVSLILELMIATMNITIKFAMLGGDDEDKYKPFGIRMFLTIFNRFQGDVFFIYSMKNWEYFVDNSIPSLALVGSLAHFLFDFQYWLRSLWNPSLKVRANYQRETFYSRQGMPKFLIDATYFLPAGSFMRWLQKRSRISIKRHNMLDIEELGLRQEIIDELDLVGNKISEFDLEEYAYKYKRVFRDMKLSAEYEAIINKGIDPSIYLDLQIGESLLEAEADEIMDALKMRLIDQLLDAGEFVSDTRIMEKNADKMKELKSAKKPVTKKSQKRKFERAMEEYNK